MVASIPLAFLWKERPRSEKSVPEQLFRCQHPGFKERNAGHPLTWATRQNARMCVHPAESLFWRWYAAKKVWRVAIGHPLDNLGNKMDGCNCCEPGRHSPRLLHRQC